MRSVKGTIPAHLRQQASRLGALEQALADCLPGDCLAHVHVADLDDRILVLMADSPAWRTRLHFHSDRIISHFNRLDNIFVERLKIRVAPPRPATPPVIRRGPPPMSLATGRALRGLAGDTEDPVLRQSLLRLARNAPEKDSDNDTGDDTGHQMRSCDT